MKGAGCPALGLKLGSTDSPPVCSGVFQDGTANRGGSFPRRKVSQRVCLVVTYIMLRPFKTITLFSFYSMKNAENIPLLHTVPPILDKTNGRK